MDPNSAFYQAPGDPAGPQDALGEVSYRAPRWTLSESGVTRGRDRERTGEREKHTLSCRLHTQNTGSNICSLFIHYGTLSNSPAFRVMTVSLLDFSAAGILYTWVWTQSNTSCEKAQGRKWNSKTPGVLTCPVSWAPGWPPCSFSYLLLTQSFFHGGTIIVSESCSTWTSRVCWKA